MRGNCTKAVTTPAPASHQRWLVGIGGFSPRGCAAIKAVSFPRWMLSRFGIQAVSNSPAPAYVYAAQRRLRHPCTGGDLERTGQDAALSTYRTEVQAAGLERVADPPSRTDCRA